MSAHPLLAADDVVARLKSSTGWSLKDGKLHREFTFANFPEAFGFMTSVAFIAESMNHHPEWANVFNRVTIDLATHSAGGITDLDFSLLERIEAIAAGKS